MNSSLLRVFIFNRKTPLKKMVVKCQNATSKTTRGICYARVSSRGQLDDLNTQVESLSTAYPHFEVVTDCGSGINWKRSGLAKVLSKCFHREIDFIAIEYRDRLARFCFELLERIVSQFNVKILVQNQSISAPGSEAELCEDLLSILHIYSCRINGRRK
eukprot:Sdes_comp20992_c0_seq1m19620